MIAGIRNCNYSKNSTASVAWISFSASTSNMVSQMHWRWGRSAEGSVALHAIRTLEDGSTGPKTGLLKMKPKDQTNGVLPSGALRELHGWREESERCLCNSSLRRTSNPRFCATFALVSI